ncbi:MAG: DUF308 domain-containing protein [Lachnospiraceae bacterium]|nr:DUF308 domain-containing protein [Lachnospiraceae bacterium]MCH4030570.1 DUF308 domain-containing protein [Lachnospiraceae bacterium]MCH4069779.1 DUF308 domain-containing protein [Lachnospiraceae bacterium]MCH4107282.1 DUF308 domain-containing protein [Lachnospiraceae bacterium]MCI1301863.1 DUF308 domain-containing protein [Lachnospiraceae bacterium]
MKNRSGFGWMELITGILMIILGVLSFVKPAEFISGLIFLYGIIAVITGIVDIIFFMKVSRRTGIGPTISLVTGTVSLMAGVMLMLAPGMGQWIVAFLFPLWFVTHCISGLSHAGLIRSTAGNGAYIATMVLNIFGLFLSILMIISPKYALVSASWLIGLFLVLLGIESVIIGLSAIGEKR